MRIRRETGVRSVRPLSISLRVLVLLPTWGKNQIKSNPTRRFQVPAGRLRCRVPAAAAVQLLGWRKNARLPGSPVPPSAVPAPRSPSRSPRPSPWETSWERRKKRSLRALHPPRGPRQLSPPSLHGPRQLPLPGPGIAAAGAGWRGRSRECGGGLPKTYPAFLGFPSTREPPVAPSRPAGKKRGSPGPGDHGKPSSLGPSAHSRITGKMAAAGNHGRSSPTPKTGSRAGNGQPLPGNGVPPARPLKRPRPKTEPPAAPGPDEPQSQVSRDTPGPLATDRP